MFGRGRAWRPDDRDENVRPLHLTPGRGAGIGEYANEEASEYSDSYYGPGDAFPRRNVASEGYVRGQYGPRTSTNPLVGGLVGARESARSFGWGERDFAGPSWADVGASSVHAGESGVTAPAEPSFRGRGPKGYVRSDERLRELVCERLTDDPRVDASAVEVEVKGGEITLSGEVADRTMKWRAEDLAEAASGGALVHNRLRTRRTGPD
jgi:hypothetical protein